MNISVIVHNMIHNYYKIIFQNSLDSTTIHVSKTTLQFMEILDSAQNYVSIANLISLSFLYIKMKELCEATVKPKMSSN